VKDVRSTGEGGERDGKEKGHGWERDRIGKTREGWERDSKEPGEGRGM
jgi:hypothetical protein